MAPNNGPTATHCAGTALQKNAIAVPRQNGIREEWQPSPLCEEPSSDRGQNHRCSRFCNCQSTEKPSGSTRIWSCVATTSIRNFDSHSFSAIPGKRHDLFWEQKAGCAELASELAWNHRHKALLESTRAHTNLNFC
jgi:hypothetical protein